MKNKKILQLILACTLLSSCQSTTSTNESYSEGLNLMISTVLVSGDDLEKVKSQKSLSSEPSAIDLETLNTLAGTGLAQSAYIFAKSGSFVNPKNFMDSTMLLTSFFSGMSTKGMRHHKWTYDYLFHINKSCKESLCVYKNLGAYWDTLSSLYDAHPSKSKSFDVTNYSWSEPNFFLDSFNGEADQVRKLKDGKTYETTRYMLNIDDIGIKSQHFGVDIWGNQSPEDFQDYIKLEGLNYAETTSILIEASKKHPEVFVFRAINRNLLNKYGKCIGAFFINNGKIIVPVELGCMPAT